MPSPHAIFRIVWPALADPERVAVLRLRFATFLKEDPETGCWLWQGYVCKFGYGRWWRGKGVSALAHRGGYELWRGPILPTLDADHLCNRRACVNPWHQEIVTRTEHARRTAERRRQKKAARLKYRRPSKP